MSKEIKFEVLEEGTMPNPLILITERPPINIEFYNRDGCDGLVGTINIERGTFTGDADRVAEVLKQIQKLQEKSG